MSLVGGESRDFLSLGALPLRRLTFAGREFLRWLPFFFFVCFKAVSHVSKRDGACAPESLGELRMGFLTGRLSHAHPVIFFPASEW